MGKISEEGKKALLKSLNTLNDLEGLIMPGFAVHTMTIQEHLEHLLERSRQLHGEDAFSTQCLKKHVATMSAEDHLKKGTIFQIGSLPSVKTSPAD